MELNKQQESYYNKLPAFPFVSHDPEREGVYKKSKQLAFDFEHIQHNPKNLVNFLVFDIDRPAAALAWIDADLAAPNIIAVNPRNGHAHLIYLLDKPVPTTRNSSYKALSYLALIQAQYTKDLKADFNYSNFISKNALSDRWIIEWKHDKKYELDYLAEFLKEFDAVKQKPIKTESGQFFGLGRNCYVFDTLRHYAYKQRYLKKNKDLTYEQFYSLVSLKALAINNAIAFNSPLGTNEVAAIAKSVAKWTYKTFSPEKFSMIQKARRARASNDNLKLINEKKIKKVQQDLELMQQELGGF